MASSSGKRFKMRARKEATQVDPVYFSHQFRSQECQEHFQKHILKRAILPDIKLTITEKSFREIRTNIATRGWKKFVASAGQGFQGLTYEFYANAWQPAHDMWSAEVSYVRGKEVPYDAAHINKVLGTVREDHMYDPEFTEFSKGDMDYDLILATLCRPGATWHATAANVPKSLRMGDLKPVPKAWYHFLIGSLLPLINDSEVFIERAKLLYAIVADIEVDVGQIIHAHIHDTLQHRSAALPYPSVIKLLCLDAGVELDATDIPVSPKPPITNMRIQRFQDQYNRRLGHPPPPTPQRAAHRFTKNDHFRLLYEHCEVLNHNIQIATAGILKGVHHNFQVLRDLIRSARQGGPERDVFALNYEQLMSLIDFENLPPNPFAASSSQGAAAEEGAAQDEEAAPAGDADADEEED